LKELYNLQCWIWGSQTGEREKIGPLGCNVMYLVERFACRTEMSPPSSGEDYADQEPAANFTLKSDCFLFGFIFDPKD
jgi:hypothetical protein